MDLVQVLGTGKKPFYDRRPQSRMRINTAAHQGFCGMCGPCSCSDNNNHINSNNPAATYRLRPSDNIISALRKENSRVKVDCWWTKPTIPEKFRTHGPGGGGRDIFIEEEEKNVE